MKKFLAAVGVLVLGTSLAIAGGGGKHQGKGMEQGGMWCEHMTEQLNLTDAQLQQIKTLKTNFQTQNEPFFAETRELKKQYRDAKKAGDTARADSLKSQLDARKAQKQQLHQGLHQQILSVLNAEQRAKFEAHQGECREHGGHHGKQGKHGH